MKYYSKAFYLFSSQIFLNIIIIISLAVCAVFVNTTYENYNYNTTELGYIKSLYGKGYVYLYSALPGNDIADNIDRDALTDCKISVVSTVNGYSLRGMTSISAYDGFLLEDLGINLVAGRLPEKNEILEVLAFNNLSAIGDKVTVKVNSNLSVNAVVVGLLPSVTQIITLNGGGTAEVAAVGYMLDTVNAASTDVTAYICLNEEFVKTGIAHTSSPHVLLKYDAEYLAGNRDRILSELTAYGNVSSVDDIYDVGMKEALVKLKNSIIVSGVLFLISFALFIVGVLLTFSEKTKFMWTLYINGYSVKNLLTVSFLYIISLSLISFLADMVAVYSIVNNPITGTYVDAVNVLLTAGTIVILMISGLALSAVKLNKLKKSDYMCKSGVGNND